MASVRLLDHNDPNLRNILMFLKYTGTYMENQTTFFWISLSRLIFGVLSICLMLYSMLAYLKEIVELVYIIHHFSILVTVLVLQTCVYLERDTFGLLIGEFGKTFDYDSEIFNSFTSEVRKSTNRMLKFAFHVGYLGAIYCNFAMNFFSTVEAYLFDNRFLLYPIDMPFSLDSLGWYLAVIVWEETILTCLTTYLFGIIIFIYALCFHLTSELDVLAFALENTEKRIREKIRLEDFSGKDEMEEEYIKEAISVHCANQCVRHHLDIIKYYNALRQNLKLIYFVLLLTGLCVLVCTLVAAVVDQGTTRYKFFSILFAQFIYIYLWCWIGEPVQHKSEHIRIATYEIDWWLLPKKCHKIIHLIMVRTMHPMYFINLTGQVVGAVTFMDIMKGTYTYFNMLLQTQQ